MDISTRIELNNGSKMPILGLGVFLSKEGAEVYNAVRWALDAGYRHIDTAAAYGNEKSVGKAIRDSGIPREEIFVTTKLWNADQVSGNQLKAFEASLERLQMDYVDLYLLHWPVTGKTPESWPIMEDIYASGRARAIGVSNFLKHHLEDLLKYAKVIPAVDQVECHPYFTHRELALYCKDKGIVFEPWSPLGHGGDVLSNPVIVWLSNKYGKTPAQIILRWGLQRGFVNIPKSIHRERIIENSKLFDFNIEDDDMVQINFLNKNRRVGRDPDNFA